MLRLICPVCQSSLVHGEKKQYETLIEHVLGEEQRIDPRPTFVCINKECFCGKYVYWNEEGEYYLRQKTGKKISEIIKERDELGVNLYLDKVEVDMEVVVDVNPETRQELDMREEPKTAEEKLKKYDELLALHDLVVKEFKTDNAFWMALEKI